MTIRNYQDRDYDDIKALYMQKELYGGEFSPDRDSRVVLKKKIEQDPESIWIAENDNEVIGTLSIIEDGRVAWLYRFACLMGRYDATELLFGKAKEVLQKRGHKEVLVYSELNSEVLDRRYTGMGFSKGGAYSSFWREI